MAEATQAVEQPQADSQPSLEERIARQFAPEDEQPAEEVQEPAEQTAEPEQAEPEAKEAETALEEVDWNGKQYKLPPELKSALMAQKDYTQKTQEVADQRRMLDSQLMLQQQQVEFQKAVSQELETLGRIEVQLGQFKQLDWTNMDTDTYIRTKHAFDTLKEQKGEVEKTIQGKRQGFEQELQKVMARARDTATEYLKRHIPTWGPEAGKELMSYGQTEGYSDVELSSLTDARLLKTLWKSQQWDKLQAQKTSAAKRAETAPPVKSPSASNPQTARANEAQEYQRALKAAKTPGERSRVVQGRFEKKLFGS
jgi:hypothetical protein